MIRALLICGALGLSACAPVPQAVAPRVTCAPQASPETTALASQGYALGGRVISLLAAGKLSGSAAIAMNRKLQTAQADIRAGQPAAARSLIQAVRGSLP